MAHAEYTYIDANATNTTLDGVTLVGGVGGNYLDDGTGGTSTDGLWALRFGSASFDGYENGNVFETDAGSTTGDREGTGNLVTSVTLPVAGTYRIVAVFAGNSLRDIAARIGSAPTSSYIYTSSNAINSDQTAVPLEIDFDSGYMNGRGGNHRSAYLGQVTTTGDNETVEVYVNGLDGRPGTQDQRTQYDGIGYELVPAATGEYTYVDASTTNTTLDSDPIGFPDGVALVDITLDPVNGNIVDDGTGGSASDDLWTYRTENAGFEDSSYFESDSGSSTSDREDTPDLITTITPPVAGTYQVVAVFTKSSNRDIAAKIGSSPNGGNIYSISNVASADQNATEFVDFDSAYTNVRGGNSGAAYLGTVVTTSAGQAVKVYVNGLENNEVSDDERTQYEGIGYRLVSAGGGNTFATWISGFSVGGLNGVSDDADGDGIDNGVENFFGTAPDAFSTGLLAGTKSGNVFTFTHPQSATPASDLTASYKWSTDLANWYLGDGIEGPGASTVTMTPVTFGGTTTVTATASGALPKLFLRVQVKQN